MVPKVFFRNKSDLTFTAMIMPRHSIFILKLFIIYTLYLILKTFGAWQESQLLIDICGFLKDISANFYKYLVVPGGEMSRLLWLESKLEISALLLFKIVYFKQKN